MDSQNLVTETEQLLDGEDLSAEQIAHCVDQLTSEEINAGLKKNFLIALSQKGESDREFSQFVAEFRNRSIDPQLQDFAPNAIDLCGTGGDKAGSFNISTFVSFVVASAGVKVIKHGNRSISSKCGSADLLQAFGIPLQARPEILRSSLEEINFAFLFAPEFHPAFKHIAPVRKLLAQEGIITIFNLLGPTLNPARPAHQILGVFAPEHIKKISHALSKNGCSNALIVHGHISNDRIQGVDELTACGENLLLGYGQFSTEEIERWNPERWSQSIHPFEDLKGGDLDHNLRLTDQILSCQCPPGLFAAILINASSAFKVCGRVSTLEEGIELADSLIRGGTVKNWLDRAGKFFA